MCSQPPLQIDDIDYCYNRNQALINSAPNELLDIGITGGEPTLAGDKLFKLIKQIHQKLPETHIHILTNGRYFADIQYVKAFITNGAERILLGVPLHSDYENDHDLITQVRGSYNDTMKGLYNMGRYDLAVELRIVINKLNYKRLPSMANFIYKNLPFVRYISFMGLEDVGYAIKNHSIIWIDPIDYQDELEEAIFNLYDWGLDVSIFNLPHCLLKQSLYSFARKSISDWKVTFLECCNNCSMREYCCGLFSTSRRQSDNIAAV
jgi:His-Xaa-Ser system radical SAM maturase HxsC